MYSKTSNKSMTPGWKFLSGYSIALVVITSLIVAGACGGSDVDEVDRLKREVAKLKLELRSVQIKCDQYEREIVNGVAENEQGKSRGETVPQHVPVSRNVPVVENGKCKLRQDKSEIDDTPIVTITCEANEHYRYNDPARLVVRYKEGRKDIYVNFCEYLGGDPIDVTFRFDSQTAETTKWSLSTDGRAAFFPSDISRFVTRLSCSDKLVIRATPYSESPRTYTFDISNFRSLVGPVRHYFN